MPHRRKAGLVQVLWGIGGMVVLLAIAVALSTNRRAIRPRTVLGALAIQIIFAVAVLWWDAGKVALGTVSAGVQRVVDCCQEGIDFLVGPILPTTGTVVAFQVLPLIVFIASLSAVLYHLGILQWVVRIIGGGLQRVLGTTKAESLNATGNIFLGQTEAPLLVRPYLPKMSNSELFAVMVGGLSTVAGSVLVGYASLGARLDYLIAASFMAAPAALLMAKIIMPADPDAPDSATEPEPVPAEAQDTDSDPGDDTATESTPDSDAASEAPSMTGRAGTVEAEEDETRPRNVIDAAATGASDGLKLALNVGAMLFAFVSLIALLNLLIGAAGGLVGLPELTFQQIIGYVFAPVMYVIGVPWNEAIAAGSFVGEKLVVNEFVAFTDFAPHAMDYTPKTQTIVTFALTGFANLSSLAILLGGLGGMVPSKRHLIAKYGMRAIAAGTLANLMNAAIAGILIS